jgi:undecaprenyl-diphosphatase
MTVDRHGVLDEAVFRALNRDAGPFLDAATVVLSSHAFGIAVAVALAAAIALVAAGRHRLALLLALAVALAASDLVGARVLRPLGGRMRPCFALPPGAVRLVVHAADVGSIPSLHASNFFAMATVAWAASRRLGAAAVAVAAAVAWSRVHGGVHWPTDVLAGAGWGALCGLAALAVTRRIVGIERSARSPVRASETADRARGAEDRP